MTKQIDQAKLLHSLHVPGNPLALPNAWDVASARVIEHAGAAVIATTSAGVAWSLGKPDGDQLGRDRAMDLVGRIAAAVGVPVTADVESGYADSVEGVGETIAEVIAAGAVGVNVEDGWADASAPLRPITDQAARIGAARRAADQAGVPLFINARVDTYLRGVGDPAGRLAATVERAQAYLAAGANGIFVPGVVEPATIAALISAISAPLNVLAGPGSPPLAELAQLGVARVSLGSAIAQAAYTVARTASRELLTAGTYGSLGDAVDYGELNSYLR